MACSCDFSSNGANVQSNATKWVGNSCGRHGSYVLYKAFQFHLRAGSQRRVLSSNSMKLDCAHTDSDVTKVSARDPDDVKECESHSHSKDERILSLGEFFFMQCHPEDPVCIGELQLLWHDKHSKQDLTSTRLYYIPETTPVGRTPRHGKDEVLAVSEKVVMRASDLSSCIVEPDEWNYGSSVPLVAIPNTNGSYTNTTLSCQHPLLPSCVDMRDIMEVKSAMMRGDELCPQCITNETGIKKEKQSTRDSNQVPRNTTNAQTDARHDQCKTNVLVLSLAGYSRHMAVMKRIEGAQQQWTSKAGSIRMLATLGAYTSVNPRTRLVFCRSTFEHHQLFNYDLICEELAPVFKGRPRRKARKQNNFLVLRSQVKRKTLSEGNRGTVPCTEERAPCANKRDIDDSSPTLRSSDRRRSKRRQSPKTTYKEQHPSLLKKSEKRFRRKLSGIRGIPEAKASKKVAPTFNSNLTPPVPTQCFHSSLAQEPPEPTIAVESIVAFPPKPGRQPVQVVVELDTPLQNHLYGNDKLSGSHSLPEEKQDTSSSVVWKLQVSSSPSSGSLDSSRQTSSIQSNAIPSPTDCSSSSHSSDLDGHPSLPFDVPTVMTAVDDQRFKSTTSGENMYIRGLCDGNLPENKSAFLELLYGFMQKRNTPIGRIPSLGFKKLDLWAFFKLSQEFGGYDMVTAKRLWKHVYDRMGGNPSCTSAATCTRKHFERLLLPLEIHLRKTLHNKDSENTKFDSIETSSLSGEIIPDGSPLNGRTFNGDAYFLNGAKITQSPPLITNQKNPELKHHPSFEYTSCTTKSPPPPSCTPVHSTSCTPKSPLSPGLNLKIIEVDTSSSVNERPEAGPPTVATQASIGNLESLAHNIIQEELLADRQSKSAVLHEGSMEDLTTPDKPTKNNSNLQNNRPIDFTLPVSGQRNSIPSSAFQSIISRGLSRTDKNSPEIFTTFPSCPRLSTFTRTHCPRVSMLPPPYVPKKSPQQSQTSDTNDSSIKRDPVPDKCNSTLGGVSWDGPQHVKLQKRLLSDDNSEHREHSSSPQDAKRLRNDSFLTTPSPSNRSYDIRNLVSIPFDDAQKQSRSRTENPSRDNKFRVLRRVSCVYGTETDAELRNGFGSQQPPDCRHPKEQNYAERRFSINPNRNSAERHDLYMTPSSMKNMIESPIEMTVSSMGRRSFDTPTRYLGVSGKQNNGDYQWNGYHPNGTLSPHSKPLRQDPFFAKDPQSRGESAGDMISNGINYHQRSLSMKDPLSIPHSPNMVLQRPLDVEKRKSLSSSVNDVTASLPAKSSRPMPLSRNSGDHLEELRDLRSASIVGSKLSRDRSTFLSAHHEPYSSNRVEDNGRAPVSNTMMYHRKNETSQGHETARPRYCTDPRHKVDYNHGFAVASPLVPEASSSTLLTKTILDGLPLPLINSIRPLIPPNCTPALLERFLQHYLEAIGASMLHVASPPQRLNNIYPSSSHTYVTPPSPRHTAESSFSSGHQIHKTAAGYPAVIGSHNSIPRANAAAKALRAHIATHPTRLRQYEGKPTNKPKDVNLMTRLTAGPQMELKNPAFLCRIPHHVPRETTSLAYAHDRR